MNIEKVKEIKKVLEEGQFNTINHHQKEGKPIKISFADILTLINELESENERLLEQRNKTYNIWVKDTEKLKDRIAELEKQMCKNEDLHTATEKLNDIIILKQFAERLKEKFNRQEKRFADTVNRYENGLDKVKESNLPTAKYLIGKATGQATMAEKAQYYIDETLKEFL